MHGEFKILIQDDTLGTLEASLQDLITFFSDDLLNDINKCTIHSGLHSDHSIIKLELNRNKLNRGRVFWKFNNNLLYDKDYVDIIKNIISECKTDLRHHIDKGLIWELTKLKIRSVSIPYCIKIKKQMTAFKKQSRKRNQFNPI